MVSKQEIEKQLHAIGADFRFWGRGEVAELPHIIFPNEQIMFACNGRYENGFAMLCVTNQRVILVDKKPLYLMLEDLRYDMITELDFSYRLFDATLTIFTLNKTLRFTALKAGKLREATAYLQGRIIDIRMGAMHQTAPAMQNLLNEPRQETAQPREYKAANPYTKMPVIMRRRASRYYSQ